MAALKNACICFRNRLRRALTAEDGMGVVEVILIIVGIFTPYYRVSIRCMA